MPLVFIDFEGFDHRGRDIQIERSWRVKSLAGEAWDCTFGESIVGANCGCAIWRHWSPPWQVQIANHKPLPSARAQEP